MIDSATFSIWAADLVLLLLAYWLGRLRSSITLRRYYLHELSEMLAEMKALRLKIDRMVAFYCLATDTARSKQRDETISP